MNRAHRPPIASNRNAVLLTREQSDFVESRVMPFLDANGMGKPLKHVAKEVYLQGLNDALDVLRPPMNEPEEGR